MFPQRHHKRIRIDHCAQHAAVKKNPTEEPENTHRDFTRHNKKRWRMSEPCTCRIQTVRVGQVVRMRATGNWCRTGVQLLTVEQECLLLEADVKHPEVQNSFSLHNGETYCEKKKCCADLMLILISITKRPWW